jgi:hypothetical protein
MQWRLEVERVGPRLRTNLAADQRDWRQHLEAAHASTHALQASWPDAKAALTKLGAEVRHMLGTVCTSGMKPLIVERQCMRVMSMRSLRA